MKAYGIPYDHFQKNWSRSEWVQLMAVWGEPAQRPRTGLKISDLVKT